LGIDYGQRRVGLAVSDALGLTAQPLDTFHRRSDAALIEHVRSLVAEREVTKIIVGLPVNMDGTYGPKADEARRLADHLRSALGLPVELWDERLTSWQAEQCLSEAGLPRKKQRESGKIDRVAAQLLLQSYLEAHWKAKS
jgi:putative Holliday junction resolvase